MEFLRFLKANNIVVDFDTIIEGNVTPEKVQLMKTWELKKLFPVLSDREKVREWCENNNKSDLPSSQSTDLCSNKNLKIEIIKKKFQENKKKKEEKGKKSLENFNNEVKGKSESVGELEPPKKKRKSIMKKKFSHVEITEDVSEIRLTVEWLNKNRETGEMENVLPFEEGVKDYLFKVDDTKGIILCQLEDAFFPNGESILGPSLNFTTDFLDHGKKSFPWGVSIKKFIQEKRYCVVPNFYFLTEETAISAAENSSVRAIADSQREEDAFWNLPDVTHVFNNGYDREEEDLKVPRNNTFEYVNENIDKWNRNINIRIVDPSGKVEEGIGRGVKKEVVFLYFNFFKERMCLGRNNYIPRNDSEENMLRKVGQFLRMAYEEFHYFPTYICKSFFCALLYGIVIDDNSFSNDLLNLLDEEYVKEIEIAKKVLPCLKHEEIMIIVLENVNVYLEFKRGSSENVMMWELAFAVMIKNSERARNILREVLVPNDVPFIAKEALEAMYLKPDYDDLEKKLKCEEGENVTYNNLKTYLKKNPGMIGPFLQFVTGLDYLYEEIEICVHDGDTFKVSVCGNKIDIPNISNYERFEEALSSVLISPKFNTY